MTPFRLLLLVFLVVPILEIYVLIEVGSVIGALSTVALVVLTAVAGATLIRAQGFSTIARVQASLDRGELPAIEIVEAAILLVAGALLLTPGFVTDTIGFVCLIAPLRRDVIVRVLSSPAAAAAAGRAPDRGRGARPRPGPDVIEGEYRREDD